MIWGIDAVMTLQLETLKHIHSKNIVYVDVKPENFMLDAAKENKVGAYPQARHAALPMKRPVD